MSRRVPFSPTVFWIFVVTVLVTLPLALSVAPGTVCAGESSQGDIQVQQYRPVVDNPEVGEPGDDDQPTIGDRKRGNVISTPSGPVGSEPNASSTGAPRSGSVISRCINSIRVLVGRLGSMLR